MSITRRLGLMALAALPGLGPINLRKLDQRIEGGVERLLEMEVNERGLWCRGRVLEQLDNWRNYFEPEQVEEELARMGGDIITCEESGYPQALKPYADHPVGLYRCRAGSQIDKRCIAIVGTRKPSAYGRRVARDFSAELSRCGFTIVSGLAEGIDTEAHRAAISGGGKTVAILGGGLKRCYPLSNLGLMKEIEESGGVWSEFPLWRRADRRSFPQRNRIVSGVSEAVLVIESGGTGGSLITARMASEQGKSVYVIPGRIDAPESTGCHALIRDGASLVTSVEEILEDLSYFPAPLQTGAWAKPQAAPGHGKSGAGLTGVPSQIWEVLGKLGSAHADDLAGEIGHPIAGVLQATMEMELSGHLSKRLDGRFERS